MPTNRPYWMAFFSERQIKEIDFDRFYFENMREPMSTHDMRYIIAKMAELLDAFGPKDSANFTAKMKEMSDAH